MKPILIFFTAFLSALTFSPAFAQTPPGMPDLTKATQKPGDERATLGEHYPAMHYDSKAAFEARGCPIK